MEMYAMECFPRFNEVVKNHFKDEIQEKGWTVSNCYKSNVVRIWQKIKDYQKNYTPLSRFKYHFIDITFMICKILGILIFITLIIYLIFNPSFVIYYFGNKGGYIMFVYIMIYLTIWISIKNVYTTQFMKGFD